MPVPRASTLPHSAPTPAHPASTLAHAATTLGQVAATLGGTRPHPGGTRPHPGARRHHLGGTRHHPRCAPPPPWGRVAQGVGRPGHTFFQALGIIKITRAVRKRPKRGTPCFTALALGGQKTCVVAPDGAKSRLCGSRAVLLLPQALGCAHPGIHQLGVCPRVAALSSRCGRLHSSSKCPRSLRPYRPWPIST